MAFEAFDYTRKWTDPDPETGFPTTEYREEVVRADMQFCFDEVRDALNDLGEYVDSGDVPVSVDADDVSFTPSPGIDADNVQDAIAAVQANIVAAWEGTILPNTIEGAMMKEGAVDTRELHDEAVKGPKIAPDAVDNEHLAVDSVHEEQIKNGSVTGDKLNVSSVKSKLGWTSKADLVNGIVQASQLCLRRVNRTDLSSSPYVFATGDVQAYVKIVANDIEGGVTVQLPSANAISVGSYAFLDCNEFVSKIEAGSGAVLYVSGVGAGSYTVRDDGEVVLVIKLSQPSNGSVEWMLIPFRQKKILAGDIGTNAVTNTKIKDKSVTYAKTDRKTIQKQHGRLEGEKLDKDSWGTDKRQTVTGLTGVDTATKCDVAVSASPDSWTVYRDCGIRCISQAVGSLTFEYETKPSGDVYFNALIFAREEVSS